MPTEYLNIPLSDFVIHKISVPESGEEYTYYLYIHPSGQSVIMRGNSDDTEYLYVNAGKGTEKWEDRTELNYTTFDRLAKG